MVYIQDKNSIQKPLSIEKYTLQEKYCDERFLSYNWDTPIDFLRILCHDFSSGSTYFSRVFFVLLVIPSICLLFTEIKIIWFTPIYFIYGSSKQLNYPGLTTMHCDMLKIQDGVTIVEKLNSWVSLRHHMGWGQASTVAYAVL